MVEDVVDGVECVEATLLDTVDNLLFDVDGNGLVNLNAQSFIDSVIAGNSDLDLISVTINPSNFSCKVSHAISAVINATDSAGNCLLQTIDAVADDLLAPVINILPVVNLPIPNCVSVLGLIGLCAIDLEANIPQAIVTDNCMQENITISGSLVGQVEGVVGGLVGGILGSLVSFGSYNVSYSYTDSNGNSASVSSLINVEGIQIQAPLNFAVYTVNNLLQSVISVTFAAFSSVDTTAKLYLRALSTGVNGVVDDIDNSVDYILVGTFDLTDDIKVTSQQLLQTAGFRCGTFYLSLYLPILGQFSLNDPVVTLLC